MPLEEYRLSADEVACVKKLAECYEKGEYYIMLTRPNAQGQFDDPLGLLPEKRAAILGVMEHMGLVFDPQHAGGLRYMSYKIAAKVVQTARAIHEQEAKKEEPRDIVAYLENTARRNRVLAWGLVAFFVLTAAVTLVNPVIELLANLGLRSATHP